MNFRNGGGIGGRIVFMDGRVVKKVRDATLAISVLNLNNF